MNERMQAERRQAARKRRGRASLPGKRTATYPYWVRLGVFLARQDPKSGLSKEKLEQRFLSKGAGKPDRTGVAPLPGIDVEKLSEEEIQELVKNWASGHKIEYILDRETGKEEPHVMMLSLTPNLMSPDGGAVAVKEPKEGDTSLCGQTPEVNIFLTSKCVLMIILQAPAAKQVVKNPLPLIRGRMKKMAKKEEKVQKWEKKRASARMRSDKRARDKARKLRRKDKRSKAEVKCKENAEQQWKRSEAEQPGNEKEHEAQGEKNSKEEKALPKKKSRKDLVTKRVRKMLLAAPYSTRTKTTGKKNTDEKEQKTKKREVLGVRADRSEVVHETPVKRGKSKPGPSLKKVQKKLDSKTKRKERVSPSTEAGQVKSPSPSKDTQQQKTSRSKSTIQEQPKSPEKQSNEQEPQSPPTLSSLQEQEIPNLTDSSDDEEENVHDVVVEDVGPDLYEDMEELSRGGESEVEKHIVGLAPLPSKMSSQEQPKSPSKLSTKERPGSPSKTNKSSSNT